VHLDRIGGGVDSDAHASPSEPAEGNTLAPYRRADIYLAGPVASQTTPQPAPDESATQKQPAKRQITLDVDRWTPQIMQGDKKVIEGIAARIATDVGPWSNAGGRAGLAQFMTGFTAEEPPWWNAREAQFAHLLNPPSQGRSASRNASEAKRARLVHDTLLLIRDYREIVTFEEEKLGVAVEELRNPHGIDASRLEQHRKTLRYMVFMYGEVEKLAWRVHAASE
jgi:hypothetical protein